jgi:phosphopantothenoylcysteine decarboxylase/phosphopantothenate--cysteine ligase
MSSLTNKRILLGVSGGIAAYKSADLTRRLMDAGADVQVVMTSGAQAFVTPLTFQALSGRPVRTDLLDPEAEAAMGHIELARWADAILIAPATANFIARLAQGRADDLLSTLCLASEAPLAIAPAMNRVMWDNPATQRNVETLRERGVHPFGPASGAQACGEVGEGRMLEPLQLVERVVGLFETGTLTGTHVVVTAGPTREPVDPVRFFSNHSSGKMGFAIAEAAIEAGAQVTLIAGPTALPTPDRCERIDVETAVQMRDAVMARMPDCDILIAAAAVADYRPSQAAAHKEKKTRDTLTMTLERNPDILIEVSQTERPPFRVGFAAETQKLIEHAREKLERKGLDMIAANRVGAGLAFEQDDNALEVLWPGGQRSLARTDKPRLARQLIALIAERFRSRAPSKVVELGHAKNRG